LQLPPDTFGDAHFSPFIIPLAKHSPWKASGVLRDMVALEIEPTMVQWSIVARGYAQHGDPAAALRILDQMEEIDRKTNDGADTDDGEENLQQAVPRHPPDKLLGTHTNVLRGFVLAGRLDHARQVEKRLVERLGYQAGHRVATDAAINLLREREEAP
jgi:pentatricopeptide repeat protein